MGNYRNCWVCGKEVQGFKHRECEFPVKRGRGGGKAPSMARLNWGTRRRKTKDMRLKEKRDAAVA